MQVHFIASQIPLIDTPFPYNNGNCIGSNLHFNGTQVNMVVAPSRHIMLLVTVMIRIYLNYRYGLGTRLELL